jgi:hypothetical protein
MLNKQEKETHELSTFFKLSQDLFQQGQTFIFQLQIMLFQNSTYNRMVIHFYL